MRLAVVGVGNAGSRIANQILAVEAATGRNLANGNSLLVNTSEPSFDTAEHVPAERRLLIGDVHREVNGQGVGGDPDLGAEVVREERNELVRAFDLLEFHQVDGVLVTAGLAGGTGGGAGAAVIDRLQAICDEPVYALGVLPAESEGSGPALNAARSLRSFVETADNVIAFDNDAWHNEDPRNGDIEGTEAATDGTEANYARANAALAKRLVTLFAAGEYTGAAAPETRVDPSDVMRTLDTGGISSIGYAATEVPRTGRLRAWLEDLRDRLPWTVEEEDDNDEEPTDAAKINRLVRRAARSKLTLPCEVSSADRALILLSGPSAALSRKGFESSRYWLEGEADVVDVMAGDVPHERSSTLTAVVLFSNVTDVPRIDAMQAQAVSGGESPNAGGLQFEATTR